MHHLTNGEKRAGRKRLKLYRPAHQGGKSHLRRAEGMARQKRPASAQLLQYQRPSLQIHATQGKAPADVRGGTAPAAGYRWHVGQAADCGGRRHHPCGLQKPTMGKTEITDIIKACLAGQTGGSSYNQEGGRRDVHPLFLPPFILSPFFMPVPGSGRTYFLSSAKLCLPKPKALSSPRLSVGIN